MKIISKLVLMALVALCISVDTTQAQLKGDSWSEIQSKGSGTLTVVYYPVSGMISKGSDNRLTGICVDVLNEFVTYVKNTHGKTIKLNYVKQIDVFSDFLSTVSNSEDIIGVSNVTITEDRKKLMDFTPAFMSNPVILMTNKNAPDISSLSEMKTKFAGFTAQVTRGTSHVEYMNKIKNKYFAGMKISLASSEHQILKAMSKDDKIFSILDFTEYVLAIKQQMPLKRQVVNLDMYKEDVGFIMPKSSDWHEIWNEFLTPNFKRSSDYRKIIVNNMGSVFLNLID